MANSKSNTQGNPVSRDEFLRKNQQQYPALNTAPKEKPADKNQPQVIPREKNPPVKQPPVTFPKTPAQPEQKQKRVPTKYDFEKVNPAQEHHRNTWDQSQPSRQNVPRNPAPAQPKQPQPKKSPRE